MQRNERGWTMKKVDHPCASHKEKNYTVGRDKTMWGSRSPRLRCDRVGCVIPPNDIAESKQKIRPLYEGDQTGAPVQAPFSSRIQKEPLSIKLTEHYR